jgi:hypothetical protein
VSCYVDRQLIVALPPGDSDTTRFRRWSQIATGNHLDWPKEKIPKVVQTTISVDVIDARSGISGQNLRRFSEFPDLHE